MSFYIYRITNKINNKHYIGQSGKIRDRWVLHKRGARLVKNGATLSDNGIQIIHLALAKYGINNFEFKIIEEVETQEEANEREIYWVSHYDSFKNGYNCTLGGMNALKTEEWKQKVKATRMANGGYGHSEETKNRMSDEWHMYHSPESMEKCHDSIRGRKLTKDHIEAIRNANIGNTYCVGHKQSEEVISKRRRSYFKQYGSIVCSSPKCDRTDGWKVDGVRYCVMHAERLRRNGSLDLPPRPAPNKGKSLSEETKRKISESKKGQKAHNKIELSNEDILKIVMDPRPSRAVAKDFDVGKRVILRIRREHGRNYRKIIGASEASS